MNTASLIVKRLGGPTEVARIVGIHRTKIYDWYRRGHIPQAHQLAILRAAQSRGVPLTADEIIGASPMSKLQGAAV
jgi:DNA-binding phage protein